MVEYHLPPEILIEVLLRLPIKSIVRCTSVCKSWYSLIRNPTFISMHHKVLNHTSNKNSHLLLVRHHNKERSYHKERYSLRFDNETFLEYRKLQLPDENKSTLPFKIVGSCNGLLCLLNLNIISLWNPTINKFISLPSLPYRCVIGFGFDSKTNDHKVVRIVYAHDRFSPEVEVYSLCMRSWRGVTTATPQYYTLDYNSSHAFINGAIHWVATDHSKRNDNGRSHNLIMVFDISDEVFGEAMLLPEVLAWHYHFNTCIGVFKGSLSIFQYDYKALGQWFCSIWVMKEYGAAESWTKQLVIDEGHGFGKFLSFWKNGEIILANDEKLFSYHPESQEIKDLDEICDYMDGFYVTCMENLVLWCG